jgi:hypothetical protein
MPLMRIEEAAFRFVAVKKVRHGRPYILLVPKKSKGLNSLGDAHITLGLCDGITMEQARALAKELNENVEKVRLIRIKP